MSTKTMKEKAAELLQKCEVVTLASVNKEGYMNKTVRKYYPKKGTEFIHLLENSL